MDKAEIEYTTLQHVIGVVHRRGSRVMTELAPAIAESLVHEVLEEFETEGHGEWPGLSEQTKLGRRGAKKRKLKVQGPLRPGEKRKKRVVATGNFKLLQNTGNLAGSITPAWDDNVAEAYTNVPYAKFHVTGTKWMPARDFFDFDREAFEGDIADMILLRLDRDVAAE
jgi:phage gpG-like protein